MARICYLCHLIKSLKTMPKKQESANQAPKKRLKPLTEVWVLQRYADDDDYDHGFYDCEGVFAKFDKTTTKKLIKILQQYAGWDVDDEDVVALALDTVKQIEEDPGVNNFCFFPDTRDELYLRKFDIDTFMDWDDMPIDTDYDYDDFESVPVYKGSKVFFIRNYYLEIQAVLSNDPYVELTGAIVE